MSGGQESLAARSEASTTLAVSIEDDGVGPGPFGVAGGAGDDKSRGFGLIGLQERVELLGGQLAFAPGVTGGSVLRAVLPADERDA